MLKLIGAKHPVRRRFARTDRFVGHVLRLRFSPTLNAVRRVVERRA